MKDIYRQIGIYRITNLKNGMSYIGKTGMNFGDRWDSHRALLRAGKHDNRYLQNAWNKYGEDSFEFAIIEAVDDCEKLNELEIRYIADFRDRGMSYNLHAGGDGGYNLGKHLSEETKRKIGEKNRAHMTGRKASAETRAKMSSSHLARYAKWTEEDRLKHGKISAERAVGYTWTEESRRRFSERQQSSPNSAKYTPDDIRSIRAKREAGASFAELAQEYGSSPSYISAIVSRRRWANI